MKIIIFLFLCAFSTLGLYAQVSDLFVGHWEGKCLADDKPLYVSVDISKTPSNTFQATFGSKDQRAADIPLQKLLIDSVNKKISFSLTGDFDTWIFNGTIKNKKIVGTVTKGTKQADFYLEKIKNYNLPYIKKDTTFVNDSVILAGTLYLPLNSKNIPALLFLHGSGGEPRFASAYHADYFARKGIAVLIYDKRGVNKSTGNWRNSSFYDLAKDAIAGIKMLETIPQINKRNIGVYGHSQGGSICPLVLTMYPSVAFGISAASAGLSMEDSDWFEVQNRFRKYVSGQDYANAMEFMKKYLEFGSRRTGYSELLQLAAKYDTTSWYKKHIGNIDSNKFFFTYYRKIGTYNATDYWKSVKQPVLILKGENDLAAPGYPSFANIEQSLKQAGNRHYKIVLFPHTTHEMHVVAKPDEFWARATPNYSETITNWINNTLKVLVRH